MNPKGKMILITLVVLVASGAFGQREADKPKSLQPRSVAFCDLLRHPGQYDDQIVRVRATWYQSFDAAPSLSDDSCAEIKMAVTPVWSCVDQQECERFQNELWARLGNPLNGMAECTFVGRFKQVPSSNQKIDPSPNLYITGMTDAKSAH